VVGGRCEREERNVGKGGRGGRDRNREKTEQTGTESGSRRRESGRVGMSAGIVGSMSAIDCAIRCSALEKRWRQWLLAMKEKERS
jgi:hypothetical protein